MKAVWNKMKAAAVTAKAMKKAKKLNKLADKVIPEFERILTEAGEDYEIMAGSILVAHVLAGFQGQDRENVKLLAEDTVKHADTL